MEHERSAYSQPSSRYVGEDSAPTTDRELREFYAYSLAAEVFAVCGVGSFLPVTLEQLARERGVLWSDMNTSCMAKDAAGHGRETVVRLFHRALEDQQNQCVVRILNLQLTTSSFAMYSFSLATFIQALTLISFSSVADYGSYRKNFLIAFGFTGAVSSMLFVAVNPQIFLLGTFLVVVGVTCLGCSFVMLNSFLPILVKNHPSVKNGEVALLEAAHGRRGSQASSTETIMNVGELQLRDKSSPSEDEPISLELALSTRISSMGVGIGYAAGVAVQMLSILILFFMSKFSVSSTLPLRMVLFMVGAWWMSFTIPAAMWMRPRPGRPLTTSKQGKNYCHAAAGYVIFAWSTLWRTLKTAVKLRQMVFFLVAWFLLSDAVATVSGTAILFARTELHMGTVATALLSITAISSGILGAFLWPVIGRRLDLKTNHLIVACLITMEIIPLYGMLGFLPFIQSLGVGGLQKSWEIFPLAVISGFVMSGLGAHCRSFFGTLIPPGSESAFFALYAITDKGSSAFGPAVVGAIIDLTGTIRPAFVFIAILIALPCPLLWMVDAEKGKADAIRLTNLVGKSTFDEHSPQEERELQEIEGLLNEHG